VNGDLAGKALGPLARSAVVEAKGRSLTVAPADRVPVGQRAEVRAALADGSVAAFRLGLGIGAALVVIGGVASLVGIQNSRRSVPCEDCPGGALVGVSADLAHVPDANEHVIVPA
jgi:hypothetical protein